YWNEITNYFVHLQTPGFVEGLNNKLNVLKRRCYGIFNLDHLFQLIFLDLEGYRLFGCNLGQNYEPTATRRVSCCRSSGENRGTLKTASMDAARDRGARSGARRTGISKSGGG